MLRNPGHRGSEIPKTVQTAAPPEGTSQGLAPAEPVQGEQVSNASLCIPTHGMSPSGSTSFTLLRGEQQDSCSSGRNGAVLTVGKAPRGDWSGLCQHKQAVRCSSGEDILG